MSKLWVVHIQYEAIVLADYPEQACSRDIIEEIKTWEDPYVDAVPWAPGATPLGWNDDSNVYTTDGSDVTLAEARAMT